MTSCPSPNSGEAALTSSLITLENFMPKQSVSQIDERLAAIEAERAALQLKRKERADVERKVIAAELAAKVRVQGRVLVTFREHFHKAAPDAAKAYEALLAAWLTRASERAAFGLPPLPISKSGTAEL